MTPMSSQIPAQQPAALTTVPSGNRAASSAYVKVSNVNKSFRSMDKTEKLVCEDICLEVPQGTFTSIVGPSGCGKSTVLNMCAGLLQPDNGTIAVNGAQITGPLTGVGYVTQDANLLPWMTVEQNIELPLVVQDMPRRDRGDRVRHWLDLVGLSGFAKHYPSQLSGGMQKRASIARSLIYEPQFVLMDEPFGPLDAMTRVILQQELLSLWQNQSNVTMIFVTHDLQEAIALSDLIVVMSRHPGRVMEVIDIDIPRPRRVARIAEDKQYGNLHEKLWRLLSDDLSIE
jgi:NitT/TauT family transport system ATP-binding protein